MRHPNPRCSYRQQYICGTSLPIAVSEPSLSSAALRILSLSAPAKPSARKKAIPFLSLSPNCLLALRCAQPVDRHNLVIIPRMAANRSLDIATSASWKIICRAWHRTRLPFLNRKPLSHEYPTVNDQRVAGDEFAIVRDQEKRRCC